MSPDTPERPVHLRPGYLALAGVGGAAGTAARAGLGLALGPEQSALAVLIANLLGSLILGFVLEAVALRGADTGRRRVIRILLGTGFCGGFTTYSTLAVTTLTFAGWSPATALAYGLGTVAAGLLVAWSGIVIARATLGARRPAGARR